MESDGVKVLGAKWQKKIYILNRKRNKRKGLKLGKWGESDRIQNKCNLHVENKWGKTSGLGLSMCSLSRSLDATGLGTARLNTANWFSTLPAPAVP